MKEKIEAILFDLDGVLVDACELHRQAFKEALFAVSRVDLEEWPTLEKKLEGLSTKKKLDKLEEEGFLREEMFDQVYRYKQSLTETRLRTNIKPDPFKVAMLQRLHKDFLIGVCTNSIRSTTEQMLDAAGLNFFGMALITNQDVTEPKPHPEGYRKLVQGFGLEPRQCMVVEDTDLGLQAALTAGCYRHLKVDGPHQVTYGSVMQRVRYYEQEF